MQLMEDISVQWERKEQQKIGIPFLNMLNNNLTPSNILTVSLLILIRLAMCLIAVVESFTEIIALGIILALVPHTYIQELNQTWPFMESKDQNQEVQWQVFTYHWLFFHSIEMDMENYLTEQWWTQKYSVHVFIKFQKQRLFMNMLTTLAMRKNLRNISIVINCQENIRRKWILKWLMSSKARLILQLLNQVH